MVIAQMTMIVYFMNAVLDEASAAPITIVKTGRFTCCDNSGVDCHPASVVVPDGGVNYRPPVTRARSSAG